MSSKLTFAAPVPVWAIVLAVALLAAVVVYVWRRTTGVDSRQRAALVALRALALLLVGFCLLRPVIVFPSSDARDAVVAVVVDASRSMRLTDGTESSRFDAARALVTDRLLPALSPSFTVDVLAMGDGIVPFAADRTLPDGRTSDLRGTIAQVRERYQGQALAGIVLVSDGAETTSDALTPADAVGAPVFTVPVGAADAPKDREVLSVSVGEATLTDSVVELAATVVGRGFGGEPAELRVLENGRAVHIRRVRMPDDGTPVTERFRVSPRLDAASLYVVELATAEGELTPDNNRYSVVVRPPGRPRRVLLVEGAPGFEHSFIKRALQQDRGLEVDSIVRKGRNDKGEETYYVQARRGRAQQLANGYPVTREALFAYDAVVLANVEADLLTSEQLALTMDFVAERGGGLLMLGARSLSPAGLMQTPLTELMPVELAERVGRATMATGAIPGANKVSLTPEGLQHPIMQLGTSVEDAQKKWQAMPPLGATTALGAGRPGASVLAVTVGTGGTPRPLVAVQRYGHGRSMVFAGEASWRWRMMLPTTNRAFETFWRQAGRWLAASAPDPVALVAPSVPVGEPAQIRLDVRDREYRPVPDANVRLRATGPSGRTQELQVVPDATFPGRFTAVLPAEQAGLVRVDAEARRGDELLGIARDWALVGGSDRELADPRRNDEVLARLARHTGGQLVAPGQEAQLRAKLLEAAAAGTRAPEQREIWHSPWMLALILGALMTEWGLRRRWGVR
ncbi:MAG TPA: glutamine amidotransferase [Vicinamibacterales bacterium]